MLKLIERICIPTNRRLKVGCFASLTGNYYFKKIAQNNINNTS